jgi:hypothetical protein
VVGWVVGVEEAVLAAYDGVVVGDEGPATDDGGGEGADGGRGDGQGFVGFDPVDGEGGWGFFFV